jgi:hypothetical protein
MKARATFRLEDRLLDAARRAAQEHGRPLTAEVDEALRKHLGIPGPSRLDRLEQRIDRLEVGGTQRMRV